VRNSDWLIAAPIRWPLGDLGGLSCLETMASWAFGLFFFSFGLAKIFNLTKNKWVNG
jgi:hypothetical protein